MSETIKPNDIEKAFVLVDSSYDLMDFIKTRASFVNNINSKYIDFEELELLNEIYEDGRSFLSTSDEHLIQKYFGKDYLSSNASSKKYGAKHQRYGQFLNRIEDPFVDGLFFSYGIFIPTYFEELFEYKEKNKTDKQHKSLLIGALTIDTIQEYTGTVKSVFNNAESLSIDIDGSNLVDEVPNFQVMNGLQTSFKDNSFDTVHTNFLLHQLRDEENNDINIKVKKLFSETHRILNDQGKLIMVEGNLTEAFKTRDCCLIMTKINNFLLDAGFRDINIKPAKLFSDINDLTKFTRSSSGDLSIIDNKKYEISDSDLIITAYKM